MAAPIPTLIPAAPAGATEFLTEEQWAIFLSLIEAVVPPIVTEADLTDKANQKRISQQQFDEAYERVKKSMKDPPTKKKFAEFLKDKPSAVPGFVETVKGALSLSPVDAQNQLKSVIQVLSTRAGSLLLTGYCTPVVDQPLHIREAILQKWSNAWMTSLKMLTKSIVLLAMSSWVATDPLFREISGYSDVPKNYRPGTGYDYKFMQFESGKEPEELETDVVIVGSGCGGGVCAKVLAQAGHKVVVLDKGYYFNPSQLPMSLSTGPYHLYENNGIIQTDNQSALVLAGSCWGGGGTVNWAAALKTQDYVRDEWAKEGLPFFAGDEFQASLDRVFDFMGASTAYMRHTPGSQAILDGSEKLGWPSSLVAQNTGGNEHYCGHCHYGCGSNEKKGPIASWLPHAAENGAQFIEGFQVDKILFDEKDGGHRVATGVVGTWTSRDTQGGVSGPIDERRTRLITIRAKKVIVSSGSLNSPLLLQRSGLNNPHIGKNLHIHPCNFVSAYFEEEARCWEGGIITSLCTKFENLDGKGHGPKLESTCGLPSVSVALQPWNDGLTTKVNVTRLRHMAVYIMLTRDRDTGRVYADPVSGRPRVDYSPSQFDAANALEGLKGMASILYANGAVEVQPGLPGVKPFIRKDPSATPLIEKGEVIDPDFVAWLKHVDSVGNTPPVPSYGSAHQMGSCRMSSSEKNGVVDPRGRVWGTENLFIADASVFPSASGVNPMITNMAISDWIAQGVSKELRS